MSNPLESYRQSQISSFRAALSSEDDSWPISTFATTTSFTTSTTPSPPPPPTTSSPTTSSTSTTLPDSLQNSNFWDKLETGARSGIISAIIITILIITVFSVWFCCGCCGLRRRNQQRRELLHPRPDTDTVPLQTRQPVTTINRMASTATRGEAPPPLYTEVTPPQHTTIAGGITHVREEEEGIISDGKMPLSEIPFEDVVLDHIPTGSSAQNFGTRHMGLGGDTTGHTNS